MMNSTHNSSCSDSRGDLLIIVESALLITIALLSQFFNVLCFRILIKSSSGHVPQNVKILLAFCNVAYLIRSFVIMTKALYNFYLIINGFDSFPVTTLQCAIYEYFYLAPCMVVYLSTFLIGLDRLRKTMQKHARDQGRATCSKILCSSTLITVFVTILYAALALASDVVSTTYDPMCYCYVLLAFSKKASYAYTIGAISIHMLTCSIYFTVYKRNNKILNSFNLTSVEHDLSDRFVKYANIKACRWLTPVTIFHAATVICVQIMATVVRSLTATGRNTVGYIETVVASVCIFGFEAYAHPILCIKYNPALIRMTRQRYPWLFRYNVVSKILFGKRRNDNADRTDEGNPAKQTNNKNNKRIREFRLKPEDNVDILTEMWQRSKNDLATRRHKVSTAGTVTNMARSASGTKKNSRNRY